MCSGDGMVLYSEVRKCLLQGSAGECHLAVSDLSPVSLGGSGVSWLKNFKGETFAQLQEHAEGTILKQKTQDFVAKQQHLMKASRARSFPTTPLCPSFFEHCQKRRPLLRRQQFLLKMSGPGREMFGFLLKWRGLGCCECLLSLEAFGDYQRLVGALEDSGEVVEETYKVCRAILTESFVTKASGCLLHHMVKETDKELLRAKVQAEIRELRSHDIKEKEALHPLLYTRVQLALALKL